jgi:type IV fimbrial biogenesis protein FimT
MSWSAFWFTRWPFSYWAHVKDYFINKLAIDFARPPIGMLLAHHGSLNPRRIVVVVAENSRSLLLQKGGFMTLRKFVRVLSDIKGFTLAEMMATAGVVAVLVAVAVPNYLAFQPNMRLNGASREVLGKLMWARSKAVQNNNTSVVTFITDHTFQVFNDANGNGSADANETITIDLQTDYSDVTFTVSGSSSTPTFNGRGTASSDTTVTITNSSGSKTITVSPTGNVKIS